MPKTIDKKFFYSKFKEEAREHIEKLNNGLLALESDPERTEILDDILREAHTLKGAAGIVEFTDIGKIVHKIEDVLISVKEKKIKLDGENVRLLFFGLDSVSLLVETQTEGQEGGVDVKKVCESLDRVYSAENKGGKKENTEEQSISVSEKTTPPTNQAIFRKIDETIRVDTVKLDKLINLVGEIAIDQIRSHGASMVLRNLVNLSREQVATFKQIKRKIQDRINENDYDTEEFNSKIIFLENLCDQLKIDIHKLWREQNELINHRDLIVSELQQEVMTARMLPIATVFNIFPRAVYDLSREQKKKIKLNMEGLETELDKKMIEEIRDPLIHLIRNAVDHGIESPETRMALGKSEEGSINLLATQEGESIVIKMEDDGAGVDKEKIKETAIKKNYINSAEIAAVSEYELLNLLFRPGFSTSEKVTDVSGRGVGLDVVKKNIEELKGTVDLCSEQGKGTTITLRLPLTLAIIRVLLVKIKEDVFALPTSSIEETVRLYAADIKRVEGEDVIDLRGTIVPIVNLADVLGVPDSDKKVILKKEKISSVIINSSGQKIGLIVDGLIGEQSVVVKSLGSYLKGIGAVAGATVLDKGEVVIILHVPDLVNLICSSKRSSGGEKIFGVQFKSKELEQNKLILLVEDSPVTRELERDILERFGYQVEIAADGMEAISLLSEHSFDLIISDIQMPRMDGFQLVEYIRKEESYKDIPVIIVSSLDKEEDVRKGAEVGANAYVLKSSFDQADLNETIKRLVK